MRNNILWAQTGYDLYVDPSSQVGFKSDYNVLYTTLAGRIGSWQGADRLTLAAWRSATFTDQNSLSVDALLVDPDGADNVLGFVDLAHDGRDDDLHLQSTVGSFHGGSFAPVVNLGTGLPEMLGATLTADAAQSPAIDRGDVASSVAEEPAPNGGYINLGAYGGTAEASLSPEQFVLVTTPDGGEVWPAGQVFPIRWRSNGFATNSFLDFDGVNDYVTMGDPANNALDLGTSATVEAWVRFDALPVNSLATIVSKDQGPGGQNKWIFGYNNNYAVGGGATFFHINGPGGFGIPELQRLDADRGSVVSPGDRSQRQQLYLLSRWPGRRHRFNIRQRTGREWQLRSRALRRGLLFQRPDRRSATVEHEPHTG